MLNGRTHTSRSWSSQSALHNWYVQSHSAAVFCSLAAQLLPLDIMLRSFKRHQLRSKPVVACLMSVKPILCPPLHAACTITLLPSCMQRCSAYQLLQSSNCMYPEVSAALCHRAGTPNTPALETPHPGRRRHHARTQCNRSSAAACAAVQLPTSQQPGTVHISRHIR